MSNSATPWTIESCNSPGQNTGAFPFSRRSSQARDRTQLPWSQGSLSLLQGIFPSQRLNPALLYCRWILFQLNHKGNPRILEWVAYSISSRFFQPRNQTSCIARGFFTNWAIRQANKGIQIGKEEAKISWLADDMILYIENLKKATRKLLEIINGYRKVTEYKINT